MMKNNRIFYNAVLGMVSCLLTVDAMAAKYDPIYADLSISGVIQVPVPCTIGGDGGADEITVKFGDAVSTSQVDGVSYRQPINYTIDCEAGINNALALSIQGSDAGFGSGVLKTNIRNLGIKITHGEKNALPLGASLPFSYPTLPKLYATPVKRPGTSLTGQPFSASATLHVFYQ